MAASVGRSPQARHDQAGGGTGVLREVQLLEAARGIPARLALVIEHEGQRFTGVLFVDNADFLVRLYETLQGYLGRPLDEIGGLEIEP